MREPFVTVQPAHGMNASIPCSAVGGFCGIFRQAGAERRNGVDKIEKLLEIGKVYNTNGIRGEIKIQPWCDDPGIFDELAYLYIGGRRYEVLRTRFHKNCEIVAVAGSETINDAEQLRNQIVTIEREMLGELPEGTYYIADLEGLTVRTAEGEVLGTIDEVI